MAGTQLIVCTGTLLSGPAGEVARLCPPESLPPSTKTHRARSAEGRFLSAWLAAVGHRRYVPPLKVVLWNQPIAPAAFAIGRYRVAQVRTNGSRLARRAPAPPPPRPPPRARCAGPGGARPSCGDRCAAGLGLFVRRSVPGSLPDSRADRVLAHFSRRSPEEHQPQGPRRRRHVELVGRRCTPPAYRLGDADTRLLRPARNPRLGTRNAGRSVRRTGADACRSGAPARGGGRAKSRRHCRRRRAWPQARRTDPD